MSGYVGDLTDKQELALQEFKQLCADILTKDWQDDHYCLRWLRARNFSVEAAKNMLEKSLDYRRRNRIDHILEEFKPNAAIAKVFPGGRCGFDKNGGCVFLYPLANILPKYFLELSRRTEVIKVVMHRMEESVLELRAQSKKLGRNVEKHTLIFDVEGFDVMSNISTVAISVFMELISAYESNYPENLGNGFILNAPPLFHLFFNMIKPLLSGATLSKVKIFGKDQAQWKAALLEVIDPSSLPVYYGGSRTGPGNEPLCEHEITYVRKLNNEVVRELALTIPEEDRVRFFTVGRRSCYDVPVQIEEAGMGLHVAFETDGHDVSFGLIRRSPKGPDDVIPTKRYDSHCGPVMLCTRIDLPGEYVLHFDNTYSSFRTKSVSLNVRTIPAAKLNDKMIFFHAP